MPINAGTATPTFRLGTAAVSRMYLGSALVFDTAATGESGGGGAVGGLLTPSVQGVQAGDASVVLTFRYGPNFFYPMPSSFSVQYSTNSGESWTSVAPGFTYSQTISSGALTGTATIGSLSPATYQFRVAGVNASGVGPYSGPSRRAIIHSVPTTPTNVTATVSGRDIALSWSASAGSGPLVYYPQFSTDAGVTWQMTVETPETYHLVSPQAGGSAYVFRVYASYERTPEGSGSAYAPQSAFSSASAPVTAPAQLASQPTTEAGNSTVEAESFSGGFNFRFAPPVIRASSVTEYRVYVDELYSANPLTTTPTLIIGASDASYIQYGNVRAFSVMGLTNGTWYRVRVTAVNSAGDSDPLTTVARPDASSLPRLQSFVVSALVPPAIFEYDDGSGVNYGPFRRAVAMQWNPAPYAGISTMFEKEYRLLSGGPWTGHSESWMPRKLENKSGNTIDVLSPGTAYIVRVREARGAGRGPWSYATVTTAS